MAMTLELTVTSESVQGGRYHYELRSASGDAADTLYAMQAVVIAPAKAFSVGDRVQVQRTPRGDGHSGPGQP